MTHIHVFAIDILPGEGIVSSGGSLRSHQVITGLRSAGATVTYSVPKTSDGVKAHWDQLSAEERENAFSLEPSSVDRGRSHLDLIQRLRPDAVVYLWPAAFTYPQATKRPIVTVFDMNGFQNVEGALARSAITGMPFSIADLTREYLNKVSRGDILIAGSEAQRAYWCGLHSMMSDTFESLDMIEVPYCCDLPEATEYEVGGPTFFSAGSFLPWNSPEGHLEILAGLIGKHGAGRLVIVGRANPLLPHAAKVNRRIRELGKLPFVEIIGGIPYGQFSQMINGRGIGIDLNAKTFEREFAVPIRTITFLAHGVPMITNDYAVLSNEIGRAKAGWQVSTSTPAAFTSTIESILDHQADCRERSVNARSLIGERYNTMGRFKELLRAIEAKQSFKAAAALSRGRRSIITDAPAGSGKAVIRPPVVLIITDDHENFLQLRVRIPFDAMYRSGRIGGYLVLRLGKIIARVGNPADLTNIDVVWVQRGPTSAIDFVMEVFDGRFAYDIDDNLLVSPSYRQPFSREWRDVVTALLRSAACITTTTPRLVDSLQRHSRVQIEHKTMMAPNVTDFVSRRHFTGAPTALLLASSDSIPLVDSRGAFFSAVNAFCAGREMPLLYVGPQANTFPEVTARVIPAGFLDYEAYRAFLRNENVMAIAPLEIRADFLTSEFINCKSDIKMVEFGAAGVPAVYSNAIPYSDSPLAVGPLVDCGDQKAVIDALEMVCDDADAIALRANESVACQRLADDVAVHMWAEAIDAARLSIPVSVDSILKAVQDFSTKNARKILIPEEWFSPEDYLAMHPHIVDLVERGETTPYLHYATDGMRQGNNWFPGTLGSDVIPATIARYRHFILTEPGKLDALEKVIAQRKERIQ